MVNEKPNAEAKKLEEKISENVKKILEISYKLY